MDARVATGLRYAAALPAGAALVDLVANAGTADEQRVPFSGMLEIGRDEEGREPFPGLLLVTDSAVSRRHCLIARSADGRWYVRDVSRNGTRVAGRRLVPNVETEICPGETLTVGSHQFKFETRAAASGPAQCTCERETDAAPTETIATVLVGDIRDYTVLVRRVSPTLLQRSVSRVFEILTTGVIERGGTIKEYPGDAVLAFWEGAPDGTQSSVACRAALELNQLARRIAADPTVWEVPDFPLLMDWALATGPVLIHTFGGAHPQGLSLVGEPVVLAFRLEKLAGEDLGTILTCGRTRALAGSGFAFRDLGEIAPKGFHQRSHVYALLEGSDQATARTLGVPLGRSP
ncbi:MAG TPA: adenylate/guanylate cyclase domain-containing protein [Tepidiformaceae bacterium]|nr:adenylate/guanylate cyclase domain-containing protein [Tepidiformaceae bacterium]